MSGLFTVAARLSNGKVISAKTFKGSYLGAKTFADESYFLKLFKEYLKCDEKRLLPENKEVAEQQYNEYESQESLVAPYHYGICFIDFIDKTVDYYNIDSRLGFIHKSIIEWEVKEFFQRYREIFKKQNGNGKLILQNILDNDMSHHILANFLYAKDKGWLKKISVDANNNTIKTPYDFNLNSFLNACLNNGKNDFPEIYTYEIPEWKINSNKHDIDMRKLEEIKENLIKKEILNEYDLLGWDLYKKKLFSNE